MSMQENVDYKLVLKKNEYDKTIIDVEGIKIGGKDLVFIAGPCAVESEQQINDIAKEIKDSKAQMLRGGAYKLRTSPYSFQGLHEQGLLLLNNFSLKYDLPVVSEITSEQEIDDFVKYVDIIQVGARNMQNYELLKKLGKLKKPILLKRGMACTIDELLCAAEYILLQGNPNVILCERGIKTFETQTRNTLDLSAVPILKKLTHLPIIVDPSHATGRADIVKEMSLAAIACGADGLLIEVNDNSKDALSDGNQAIDSKTLKEIINKANKIKEIIE